MSRINRAPGGNHKQILVYAPSSWATWLAAMWGPCHLRVEDHTWGSDLLASRRVQAGSKISDIQHIPPSQVFSCCCPTFIRLILMDSAVTAVMHIAFTNLPLPQSAENLTPNTSDNMLETADSKHSPERVSSGGNALVASHMLECRQDGGAIPGEFDWLQSATAPTNQVCGTGSGCATSLISPWAWAWQVYSSLSCP